MVARNDVTGDKIQTRDILSKEGEEAFDRIFGKKKTNGGWQPPPLDVVKPTSTPTQPIEYAEDWQSSKRDWAVSQNGNVGYSTTDQES
jgi:hypothetical protein